MPPATLSAPRFGTHFRQFFRRASAQRAARGTAAAYGTVWRHRNRRKHVALGHGQPASRIGAARGTQRGSGEALGRSGRSSAIWKLGTPDKILLAIPRLTTRRSGRLAGSRLGVAPVQLTAASMIECPAPTGISRTGPKPQRFSRTAYSFRLRCRPPRRLSITTSSVVVQQGTA